ncbi:MAG: nucleoside triphosphate pyrophosphohydrolase [Pseudomonadota bacterium]
MAALRAPVTGCPWDIEQTFRSIVPYTVEEAYEVADAIERGDMEDLREELGDLLLQVVYHAQMAAEDAAFDFGDVVEAITAKMIRRHPHVFGDEEARSAGSAKGMWDKIKAEEKAERTARRVAKGLPPKQAHPSILHDVPPSMEPMMEALKLQQKMVKVGFDWDDKRAVIAKIREELDEVEAELDKNDVQAMEDETGDLLFTIINFARHVGVDPGNALRGCNAKVRHRFGHIEKRLAETGKTPLDATLDEMELLWVEAKAWNGP